MLDPQLAERVTADILRHVRTSKGYEEGGWVNPLVPADPVAVLAMAARLIEESVFDYSVAVAPEGHVYGYFFEQLGATVLSLYVDYPPRRCEVLDDMAAIRDQSVLILEDDVVSGLTLQLVVKMLKRFSPASIDLYLGRRKEDQILENVPSDIRTIYVAEDWLDPAMHREYAARFVEFFAHR
jgi:hypothetical protein